MKVFLPVLFLLFISLSCKKNNDGNRVFDLKMTVLRVNVNEALQSVFFLNGKDGFVGGYNGGIYKTTDSAKTWTTLNSTVNLPIRSLFFTDALKGFAVGGNNSCGGTGCTPPGGFILRTIDGGQTWTNVHTPSAKIEINSVHFVNANLGFCAGDNMILKTIDGGQTWTEQTIPTAGVKMMHIKFVGLTKGYIASWNNKIIQTDNLGQTWTVTSPQQNIGYYSVAGNTASTYASGSGKIIKTTNGGSSWEVLPDSPADIFALGFIDDNNGFAFGRGNYSGGDWGYTYGSIYRTKDGGISWDGSDDIKIAGPIAGVSITPDNTGYALGRYDIIRFNTN